MNMPALRIVLAVIVASAAHGQTVIEYGLGTAAGGLGAAGSSSAGGSIGAVFERLNQVLGQAGGTPAQTTSRVPRNSRPPETPDRNPVDTRLLNRVMPEAKLLVGVHLDRIIACVTRLGDLTQPLAEAVMNNALTNQLKGVEMESGQLKNGVGN